MTEDSTPERLISRARAGDESALGRLLELYRNYLRLAARSMIGAAMRTKVDPSDLVQETFLKAHRDFAGFQGHGENELVAWLRRILSRNVSDQIKHHRRMGRDYKRQQSLELLLECSGPTVQQAMASRAPSPSEGAAHRERAVHFADAVDRLPADYREVFLLRTIEHVPFEEIAPRMGRSIGAVRMLWARALEKLNGMLEGQE
jgi:RNA polymerase sigma-70 factor (ECF subfamily)